MASPVVSALYSALHLQPDTNCVVALIAKASVRVPFTVEHLGRGWIRPLAVLLRLPHGPSLFVLQLDSRSHLLAILLRPLPEPYGTSSASGRIAGCRKQARVPK